MTPPNPKNSVEKNQPNNGPRRTSNRIAGVPPNTSEEIQAPATRKATPARQTSRRLEPLSPLINTMNTPALSNKENTVDTQPEEDGKTKVYPNIADDPESIEDTATPEEKEIHWEELRQNGQNMLKRYKSSNPNYMKKEVMWLEFIRSFRPHSIKAWTGAMQRDWTDFLIERSVNVNLRRDQTRAQALIDLLYRETYEQIDSTTVPDLLSEPSEKATVVQQTSPFEARKTVIEEPREHYIHPDRRGNFSNNIQDTYHPTHENLKGFLGSPRKITHCIPKGDPDEDPSEDDDDEKPRKQYDGNEGRSSDSRYPKEEGSRNDHAAEYDKRGLGINGMIKAFSSKETFSGAWEEDLDNSINIFETLAIMCELNEEEKLKSIPVMLRGDALSFYATNVKKSKSYDEAMNLLRKWYNSEDKKARILSKWQGMSLTKAMTDEPEESEVEIFRKFVAKMISLQKQLDDVYHADHFLRDRLLTAVDIPKIQLTLRDRMPRNSQNAIQRVANQLSDKLRSAGTNIVCSAEDDSTDQTKILYSLGKTFGGDAKTQPKNPWPSKSRRYYNKDEERRRRPHRQLNSAWWKGVKGCFVCGKDHLARTRHGKDEITKAIDKLRSNHPSALLTVEDLAFVIDMVMTETDEKDSSDEDYVKWIDEDQEDPPTAFLMTEKDASSIEKKLANTAFIHGRTHQGDMNLAMTVMRDQLKHKSGANFDGVRLDTAANRRSVISKIQYDAYQNEFGRKIIIRPPTKNNLRGIGGQQRVIGEATIQIPFNKLGLVIDVDFAIINSDIPTLLSNKDMIDNGLDLSLQGHYLHIGPLRQPLSLENYFLVYRWSADDTPYALYTEPELRRIHRTFGHPSVKATYNLLKRASKTGLDKEIRLELEKIADDCKVCKTNSSTPRRFKLTVGSDELRFNHRVIADTMFLDSKPVLHMIDESTHFTAATFLRNQSTEEIFNNITRLWSMTYMGPPDFLAVDQGSAYISDEMKRNLEATGIQLEEAPIESPGSIGIVERYHAPLRRAYKTLRESLNKEDTSDADCLRMAVYASNATMGPEGLCPMLLVFGALPRPARKTPSPNQLQRQHAIEEAKKAVLHEQGKRRIAFALRHPSSPKAKELSQRLLDLPAGSPVLVYRTKTKQWEGPYKYIAIEGETVTIQLPRGRKIFRTTCVKPWTRPLTKHDTNDQDQHTKENCCQPEMIMANIEDDTGNNIHNETKMQDDIDLGDEARKVDVKRGSLEEKAFSASRKTELEGLLRDGTFKPTQLSDVPHSTRIFGCRFVDELKKVGAQLKKKSRLVAQNYSDIGATCIPTKAPTVQRYSQRTALSIAVSSPHMESYTRDITQAYVQSNTMLERNVYIKAPPELDLPDGFVLKVVKPLYGIPESGLHWYLTYLTHHLDTLHMTRSKSDPCVLIKRSKGQLEGLILLQVDDTLGLGTTNFMEEEQHHSQAFRCKPRTRLSAIPTTFNGITITSHDNMIKIQQTEKIMKLKPATTDKEFASQRALAQYIGVNVRPDTCAPIQLIAPGNAPTTKSEFKTLKKATAFLKDTKEQGLNFVPLNLDNVRLVVVTDASFANAPGSKSQLGYIIMMVDDDNNSNIIHYGSNRCSRIARSVMAAELHALTLGFDYAFVIKDLLEDILGRKIKIEALIDSKTVFNVITKEGSTTERRLQIDILALRQSYDIGELHRIGWIPGPTNPADSLTKEVLNTTSPLFLLMTTNKCNFSPHGWAISREKKKPGMSILD